MAQYDLAEQIGMGITPLRAAIRRLRGEGLIDLDNHKYARVSPISVAEVRQMFEVRLVLEPTSATPAAQRRTEIDIATMRDAVDRLLSVTRQWASRTHRVGRTGRLRIGPCLAVSGDF